MENIEENKKYIKMKNKKNTWLAIAIGLLVISLCLSASVSVWKQSSENYCEFSNDLVDLVNTGSDALDIDIELNKIEDCSYAVTGNYEE